MADTTTAKKTTTKRTTARTTAAKKPATKTAPKKTTTRKAATRTTTAGKATETAAQNATRRTRTAKSASKATTSRSTTRTTTTRTAAVSTPETSVEAKVTTPRVDLGRVTTPTYALIGATDLAVERARRLTADLVALPGRTVNGIISAPGAVLAAGLTSVSRAQRGYEDLAERGENLTTRVVEQTGSVEDPGVGAGAGDVVRGQAPVELGGLGQGRERVRRAAGEAPAPQGAVVGAVLGVLGHHSPSRWSRAEATLEDIPNSSMKPLAWDWSKESPSS